MTVHVAYLPLAAAFGLCAGVMMCGSVMADHAHGWMTKPDCAELYGRVAMTSGMVGMLIVCVVSVLVSNLL